MLGLDYLICFVEAKAGIWGEVRGGSHLPWDDFAPLLKFSPPFLRNFATSPNNIINETNFKRPLYKLDKKV